ncbi:MAG: glycosyltransferase [Cytophagaceae bacterium]
MKIRLFYQSLLSEYNHASANFLRGIVSELLYRGHDVKVFEPLRSECLESLISHYGDAPIKEFKSFYKNRLNSYIYEQEKLNLEEALHDADLVIVHEKSDPKLISEIGNHRQSNDYKLLFHDSTYRRLVGNEGSFKYSLNNYDGLLAGCNSIKETYLKNGWIQKAWTFHEAIDSRVFYPYYSKEKEGEIVCIGNWVNGERASELEKYLIDPVNNLRIRTSIYGVGYPEDFLEKCKSCNVSYKSWVANYRIPNVLTRYSLAMHIPRKPYYESVPGKPATGIFEAMACGVPVISSPWEDTDGLFNAESDYVLSDERAMESAIRNLLKDRAMAMEIARNAMRTINKKHTCWHRVNLLGNICRELGLKVEEDSNGRKQEAA